MILAIIFIVIIVLYCFIKYDSKNTNYLNSSIYCINCGCKITEKDKICLNCGTEYKKKCGNCGNMVNTDWRKCPYCDRDIERGIK